MFHTYQCLLVMLFCAHCNMFQRLLEIEDNVEEERKTTQDKVESLESIVRMFELKNKNASDHGESESMLELPCCFCD